MKSSEVEKKRASGEDVNIKTSKRTDDNASRPTGGKGAGPARPKTDTNNISTKEKTTNATPEKKTAANAIKPQTQKTTAKSAQAKEATAEKQQAKATAKSEKPQEKASAKSEKTQTKTNSAKKTDTKATETKAAAGAKKTEIKTEAKASNTQKRADKKTADTEKKRETKPAETTKPADKNKDTNAAETTKKAGAKDDGSAKKAASKGANVEGNTTTDAAKAGDVMPKEKPAKAAGQDAATNRTGTEKTAANQDAAAGDITDAARENVANVEIKKNGADDEELPKENDKNSDVAGGEASEGKEGANIEVAEENASDVETAESEKTESENENGGAERKNSEKSDGGEEKLTFRERRARRKNIADITHFDNHSFLALLVRSFLSFMVVTVGATLLIVLIANWASNNSRLNVSVQSVPDYEIELSNNTRNPSIPLDVILGVGGWMDIVNAETGEILYTAGTDEEHTYTPDEIACIQSQRAGDMIRSITFQTADGDYNYFISKSYSNGSDVPDEYMLLSSDLRQLSGTMPEFEGKESFTRREFELLVYNPLHEGEELLKHYFTSRDGTPCYAIYLDTNNDETSPPWMFVVITIIGIAGLLFTALGFYIRYINKHVQRPINALGTAMAEFAKNDRREKLNYIGSKDFEQLIAAFNEMVDLLNASEQQRLALEQDRQRMLAGLSHDLKTPMTVIEGFSKAMRDGVISEEDKPKYLNLIISKSEYMSELINEFYEYSKLDHPDFTLNKQPTDFVEFVRAFFAAKYDEFDIRGYELQADLSDSRVTVDLDHEQFTRVMDNLVGNFFKYTPVGSVLTVSENLNGDSVELFIKDNGGGIPEKARGEIFAPFVVAEESRSKQGTGLGLAVCKKIVDAHGGSIELLEPEGEYKTVFEISLPVLKDREGKN